MCLFLDVFEIPYDELWELDRNCFQQTETLGEGAFGVVVKANAVGLVRCEEEQDVVAIKMLKGVFYIYGNEFSFNFLYGEVVYSNLPIQRYNYYVVFKVHIDILSEYSW